MGKGNDERDKRYTHRVEHRLHWDVCRKKKNKKKDGKKRAMIE